jgi:hypothetical protein
MTALGDPLVEMAAMESARVGSACHILGKSLAWDGISHIATSTASYGG